MCIFFANNFSLFLHMCGLRPRIERHNCTFEGTDLVRVHFRTLASPPRKYGRSMQPIYKKISSENKFSLNFLAYVHFLLYFGRRLCEYLSHSVRTIRHTFPRKYVRKMLYILQIAHIIFAKSVVPFYLIFSTSLLSELK